MTKIKICGITQREELEEIINLGVDFAGIIMVPDSSRYVDFSKACTLLNKLEKNSTKIVAVVKDLDWKEAEKIIEIIPIDFIQFHGSENPEYCEEFHFPYIKVLNLNTIQRINDYSTDYILIDSVSGPKYGGTGKIFDWNALKNIPSHNKKLFIAGGLNPENVQKCISTTHPFAVDVSSGVEISPGIKDINKIKDFILKVKESKS